MVLVAAVAAKAVHVFGIFGMSSCVHASHKHWSHHDDGNRKSTAGDLLLRRKRRGWRTHSDSPRGSTVIERIFTRSSIDASSHEHQSIRVVAGAGIEGDRYFDKHEEPGQNMTLIEAEALERFAAEHHKPIDPSITGRNLVTRGVKLNALVGREFTVGAVRMRGVELCEPCLGFGAALSSSECDPPQVVKAFVHRAGLRADVLSTGEVCVGAVVASGA